LNFIKKKIENNNEINNKNTKISIEKLLNYLVIEKKVKTFSKNLFKFLNIKDLKLNKKKEKLNVKKFFINVMNDVILKEKINKLSFFNDSRNNILKKDNLETIKKSSFCSFPKYIEKNELEKMDNKLLYNTVKKYNEEKTKAS